MNSGLMVQLSPRFTNPATRPPRVSAVLYWLLVSPTLLISVPGTGGKPVFTVHGQPVPTGKVRTPSTIPALTLVPAML